MSKLIIFVGPFPPPVHGASVIAARAADVLEAADVPLHRCDVSPARESRGIRYHISRVRKYWAASHAIMSAPLSATLYIAVSGGAGLIYDLALILISRTKGQRCILHHHSFAYLNNHSVLMNLIVVTGGADQIHITLGEKMTRGLRQRYGTELHCEPISNLAFMLQNETVVSSVHKKSFRVLGYLSNISFGKGIDRFLDVVSEARKLGLNVKAIIAGPFADSAVQTYVEGRITEIGGIEYLGPIFGETKRKFFETIDLFVFPTRYTNEAAPLVIYEAQKAGVPVVVTDRGCLREMATAPDIVLDAEARDLSLVVCQIAKWVADPAAFILAHELADMRKAALADRGKRDFEKFLEIFRKPEPAKFEKASSGN